SGMILIHAHFAQFLFVGAIGGAAVIYVLIRAQRDGELRTVVARGRRDFIVAAAMICIFAMPPLLEIALDHPNNLDAVLAYVHRFGGVKNNLGMSVGFLASLFLFIGAPEVAVTKG